MNILDAIKSGKPFKRKNERDWTRSDLNEFHYYRKDLLADDYEIQEEPKKLRVWLDCEGRLSISQHGPVFDDDKTDITELLKKALGL